MTVKEFWHLKYGTVVSDSFGKFYGWTGKVVKREVHDECSGLLITRSDTFEIKSGRKMLEITFDCGNGNFRYVNSLHHDLSTLKIVNQQGGAL